MPRDQAAELGQETVRILEAGRYVTASGQAVDVRESLRRCVEATRAYPPDQKLAGGGTPGGKPTAITVTNETTLAAARPLVEQGLRVVALNFASATAPGGGFLSGARAQEESLARSSGLYACLVGHPMYAFHRERRDATYTDYAIHSPDVPVIRTDDGALLERPWPCSFITCAAVNASAVLQRDPSRRPEILRAMRLRVGKVLAVAAAHAHETLVLGAWGCGAFGNDADEIAGLFREALAGPPFAGAFATVVFAVTDWSQERRFIGPFARAFGA
jgi:uncharacterized protein (TIGR02452 family)